MWGCGGKSCEDDITKHKNARQVVGRLEGNIWENEKELRNLQRYLKLGFTMTYIFIWANKQPFRPFFSITLSPCRLHTFRSMGPLHSYKNIF